MRRSFTRLFKVGGDSDWDLLDRSGCCERLSENAAGFEDYAECLQLGPCGFRDTNPCQTGGIIFKRGCIFTEPLTAA